MDLAGFMGPLSSSARPRGPKARGEAYVRAVVLARVRSIRCAKVAPCRDNESLGAFIL